MCCSREEGVNLNCTLEVEFRVDLFKYLFSGKGRRPPRGLDHFYELEDFDSKTNWYRCFDKLGNDFPVRLHSKIVWSALVYDKLPNGQLQPKARSYHEFIVVTLVKKRCG